MARRITKIFSITWPTRTGFGWGDVVVVFGLVILLFFAVSLSVYSPEPITTGESADLSRGHLALYATLSLTRMAIAYVLSFVFALVYGYVAATNKKSERVLIPLLDILQSLPILSFLPVALLSLSAILPARVAAEFACILLICTSQVWNMILSWYQSLMTIPTELREASDVYQFDAWLRLRVLQLPFAAIGLIWNSMMSWAGGFFFLMAAESFTVGDRNFKLPGIGTYLHEAANAGDTTALFSGIGTLVAVIVIMDQLVWQPLVAWSEKYRVEYSDPDREAHSWFFTVLQNSRLAKKISLWLTDLAQRIVRKHFAQAAPVLNKLNSDRPQWLVLRYLVTAILVVVMFGSAYAGTRMLVSVPLYKWKDIAFGVSATFLRVVAAIGLALLWTIPVGVLIGSHRKLAVWMQPIVQIAASVPSTALFPLILLMLINAPGGLNLAAIILMLMGAQWYLLFNVIAGANAIPQDLKQTALLLQMSRSETFRQLTLPALLPFIVTGAITASGGAWNASVVAEYVQFGGKTVFTSGIGSIIADATSRGDYPLLLASTICMVLVVVIINRLFWRRLYRLSEERYRID